MDEKALAEAYPGDVAKAMVVFARHNCDPGEHDGWHFRRDESAGITDWPSELKRLGDSVSLLKRRLPSLDEKLFWELEGWLDVQGLQVEIAQKAIEFDREEDPKSRSRLREDARKLNAQRAVAAEKARERFAAATFAGDRGNCKCPETADRVLEPMIRRLLQLDVGARREDGE